MSRVGQADILPGNIYPRHLAPDFVGVGTVQSETATIASGGVHRFNLGPATTGALAAIDLDVTVATVAWPLYLRVNGPLRTLDGSTLLQVENTDGSAHDVTITWRNRSIGPT